MSTSRRRQTAELYRLLQRRARSQSIERRAEASLRRSVPPVKSEARRIAAGWGSANRYLAGIGVATELERRETLDTGIGRVLTRDRMPPVARKPITVSACARLLPTPPAPPSRSGVSASSPSPAYLGNRDYKSNPKNLTALSRTIKRVSSAGTSLKRLATNSWEFGKVVSLCG